MLRALAVAAALGAAAIAGAAQAAPVYNWTGLYVGGFGGAVGGNVTPEVTGSGPSGFDTGATLGYAWQAHGSWVFEPFIAVPLTGQTGDYGSYDPRIDWAFFAGLKAGVAMDRWLPYAFVAAGWAAATVTDGSTSEQHQHRGISFGVGADYMLNDRWSVGARWAHVAFDRQHYFFSDFGWSGNSIAATVNLKLK